MDIGMLSKAHIPKGSVHLLVIGGDFNVVVQRYQSLPSGRLFCYQKNGRGGGRCSDQRFGSRGMLSFG